MSPCQAGVQGFVIDKNRAVDEALDAPAVHAVEDSDRGARRHGRTGLGEPEGAERTAPHCLAQTRGLYDANDDGQSA